MRTRWRHGAQIPIKSDPAANEAALAKVRVDKEREASDGHDGTWVAHPGLVPLSLEVFNRLMPTANQLGKKREDVKTTAADLLKFEPQGPITEAGLHANIEVAIAYLGAWAAGTGCVPIHNLMEDAPPPRSPARQLWQWIHSPRGVLEDGRKVTLEMVRAMIPDSACRHHRRPRERKILCRGEIRTGSSCIRAAARQRTYRRISDQLLLRCNGLGV